MPRGRKKATPEPSPAAPDTGDNGAGPSARSHPQPRRLGIQAASHRAQAWRRAHPALKPDQDALLTFTARLLIHGLNLSGKLFAEGELRQDGEPKAALKTLLDYHERVTESLQKLFGEDGDGGDLSSLFQRGRS